MDDFEVTQVRATGGKIKIGLVTTYRTVIMASVAVIGFFVNYGIQQQKIVLSRQDDMIKNVGAIITDIKVLNTNMEFIKQMVLQNRQDIDKAKLQQDEFEQKYIWNNPYFNPNGPKVRGIY